MGFIKYNLLKSHMKTHTGEKSYQCNQCPRTFAQGGSLKSHMKTHTKGESYPQSQVNTIETSNLNSNFQTYLQVPEGESHYIGNQWQNSIQANYSFRSHTETQSNNLANSSDLEKPLERNTEQTPYLTVKRPYSSKVSPYHIEKSLYLYSSRKDTVSPTKVASHTEKNPYPREESPYPCNQCPNSFTKYNLLKSHMKTHTGKKSYQCNQCPRTFAQGGSLKSHMKTHTEEKSYPQSQVNITGTPNSNTNLQTYLQVPGQGSHYNQWPNSVLKNYSFQSHIQMPTQKLIYPTEGTVYPIKAIHSPREDTPSPVEETFSP